MSLLSEKNHIVLLGHTGFIGGAIHRYLLREGFPVTAVSSKTCNLLDTDQVEQFFHSQPSGTQVIFCAAILRTVEHTYDALLGNMQMVKNVLQAINKVNFGSLIFFRSVDVYGSKPPLPITEKTIPNPSHFYGISKLAGEFLLSLPNALDCPLTILRIPGIYGPGDRGRSVIGRFTSRLLALETITITGKGTVKRDYVEVGDVCQLVRLLIEKPLNGVLNVATGTSYSIMEVVSTLAEVVGQSPIIEYTTPDSEAAGDLIFDTTTLKGYFPSLQFKNLTAGSAAYISHIGENTINE